MFILDTNVISELRHFKLNQSPEVRRWAAAQSTGKLFLSSITILELEQGILALERRTPLQGSALRIWLTGVRAAFIGRILPFTGHSATICGVQFSLGARRHDCGHGPRARLHGGHPQYARFCQYRRDAVESSHEAVS